MPLPELLNYRSGQIGDECRGEADAQDSARKVVNVPNGPLSRFEIGQRTARIRQEGLSSIGSAHHASRAVEQMRTQPFFKLPDLLR